MSPYLWAAILGLAAGALTYALWGRLARIFGRPAAPPALTFTIAESEGVYEIRCTAPAPADPSIVGQTAYCSIGGAAPTTADITSAKGVFPVRPSDSVQLWNTATNSAGVESPAGPAISFVVKDKIAAPAAPHAMTVEVVEVPDETATAAP